MLTALLPSKKVVHLPCSKILGEKYSSVVSENIVLDLVNVFSATYIADISTKRLRGKRKLSVSIPVSTENLGLWIECKKNIAEMLDFVTEDDNDMWDIGFYPVTYQATGKQTTLFDHSFRYDNVSLLSGGLDSFCGIFDNQIKNKATIFCGYKTNSIDASHIAKVYNFIRQENIDSELVLFEGAGVEKETPTQRTRSLLFFALACFTATWKNIKVVKVYENGIMTLNPSFESRGTTKTTHPKTIYLFQKLLNMLGLDVLIDHPYLFYTKGEMISSLPLNYWECIKNTRSCSKSLQVIKYRRKSITSCGACVPCLLRKISLAAYDLENYDHNYFIPYAGDFSDTDYNSSYSYFERFFHAIEQDTILANLEIRGTYYSEPDYLERTSALLKRFYRELKIFFSKNGR